MSNETIYYGCSFDHLEFIKRTSHKNRYKYKEIIDSVMSDKFWCNTFAEAIYCIKNDIKTPPKCYDANCDNGVIYKTGSYSRFCSLSCSSKNQSKESKEKKKLSYKKTMNEKHGVDNYFQLDSFLEDRFSEDGWEERRKSSLGLVFNEKFGGASPFCDNKVKKKAEDTIEERYGSRSFFATEKYKSEEYAEIRKSSSQKGYRNAILSLQRKHNDESISSPMNIPGTMEKCIETRRDRYGCDWPMQNYESFIKNQDTLIKTMSIREEGFIGYKDMNLKCLIY